MSWEFLVTSLVVVFMPGTGVVYTLAVSIGQGFRAGLVAAFGCTLGIVPHMVASILGLAAVLHASALLFQLVKVAGVVYLLWMAWNAWRGTGTLAIAPRTEDVHYARRIRDGIILNLLNPKLSVFFLAFLPQFVRADAPDLTLRMVTLALIFMVLTFAAFALYAAFAASLRDRILADSAAMAWLRGIFAAAFAGLGLRLALASQ